VAPGADARALDEAMRRGRIIGEAANFARSLANEPGNVLTPREFAARVAAAARPCGLGVEVLDETHIKQLGMNLLLGVAQGSAEPPRVIILRHEPANAPATPVLGFVGKGITFDSGGISIKPADGMERMKDDMAGGAGVAAAMIAAARLGAPCRIIGVIPTTENMPGGRATRPGDVIIGASGKSVEVINTDAEGRLILGDALWYARELGATHLVDVATLTGACMVALGRHVSGLFGQPEAWVETVRSAAWRGGDRVWPMPIYEEAREQIRSEIADILNSAGRPGGAITAAAFLREFVADVPWAHLDVAGTAWAETKEPYQPKGATGVAVRLLTELAMTGGRSSPAPASPGGSQG
jgi:leucyl aminopeptidase